MKYARKLLILPQLLAMFVTGIGGLLIIVAAPVEQWCCYKRTGKRYDNGNVWW